ncbi:MAG: phosphatidylserine decarboxylase family protein [Candidatus Aminicenantes bacterium]|nr:MAG: phosphatidylserine decarboxylase family protein [Candidatus Aminicenantes bacterium]
MIAPEGWPFVWVPLGLGGGALFLGWPWLGWPLVALGLFALFFFRNPERNCDHGAEVACSPADGKVIVVGSAPDDLAERGLPRQISVFMSVFDVHVNRAPITGELVEYQYNKGRKFSAFKEKASLENEQNLSVWEGRLGRIALKQIAGLIARRIVFDHSVGDTVPRAGRIGLIRYGSRVDIFLPDDAQILVRVGDRVHAGESPLAILVAEP